MRSILYLLKKIRQYDSLMLGMILLYTLLSAVYPFIWVVTPARILDLAPSGQTEALILLVLVSGLFAVLASFLLAYLKGNYRMRMNNVRYHLIRDLMRYSLEMPYEDTLDPKKLDAIHLANDSVLNPQSGAGGIILTLLSLAGELFASLAFLGIFSVLSAPLMILLLAFTLLTFWLRHRASGHEYSLWENSLPIYRKRSTLFQYASEPMNQKDIRSYGLYALIQSYINRYHEDSLTLVRSFSAKMFTMETAAALFDLARDAFLYGWLILAFLRGDIDVSQFYLYTSGLISFVTLANQAMTDMAKIHKESAQFSVYQQVMGQAGPPDGSSPSGGSAASSEKADAAVHSPALGAAVSAVGETTAAAPSAGPEIRFENVSFRYPSSDKPVLNGINLTIRPGERLALVGENGSGKSTLIKLLCRFYRPTGGRITVDGRDIWNMPEEGYMKYLSAVFQDAMVFPFSVEDNICLGKDEPALLNRVLKESGMDRIAAGLKKGVKTSLLRILDDEGADLSGGQRQRLFLARALYQDDSRILILDEPTAALDPLAERELYEEYGRMANGKTSLFVSHRLASTHFCDHIALLQNGSIQEYGTHKELAAAGGLYAELYEIQAQYYQENYQEDCGKVCRMEYAKSLRGGQTE